MFGIYFWCWYIFSGHNGSIKIFGNTDLPYSQLEIEANG
jgi:hypothetical protein